MSMRRSGRTALSALAHRLRVVPVAWEGRGPLRRPPAAVYHEEPGLWRQLAQLYERPGIDMPGPAVIRLRRAKKAK
jgi:hypothetical protein